MFTDCPGCRRQFHVNAEQLSAALGHVICGFCGKQFNAIPRLRDKPVAPLNNPPAGLSRPPDPPGQPVDTDSYKAPARQDTAVNTGEAEILQPAAVPPGIRSASETRQRQPVSVERTREAKRRAVREDEEPELDIPELLLGSPALEPSRSRVLFWVLATLLLVTTAVIQLAWFNRDTLLGRYPDLIPRVRQMCQELGCEVFRKRDLGAIQLVNRDVRDHPRYQGALLVNATMSNESEEIQPYPGIRLQLFDTAGQLVAYRDFEPREYLDSSINLETGMLPGQPVHVVLEVTGSTTSAVSFEFAFF